MSRREQGDFLPLHCMWLLDHVEHWNSRSSVSLAVFHWNKFGIPAGKTAWCTHWKSTPTTYYLLWCEKVMKRTTHPFYQYLVDHFLIWLFVLWQIGIHYVWLDRNPTLPQPPQIIGLLLIMCTSLLCTIVTVEPIHKSVWISNTFHNARTQLLD